MIQAVSGQWYCLFRCSGLLLPGRCAVWQSRLQEQAPDLHRPWRGYGICPHGRRDQKFFPDFQGRYRCLCQLPQDCRFCRMNAYSNGTGRPVIFDRIFNQIIDCPVQKDIAACNSTVTFCLNKPDLMLFCNRVQIAENLFCECCKEK